MSKEDKDETVPLLLINKCPCARDNNAVLYATSPYHKECTQYASQMKHVGDFWDEFDTMFYNGMILIKMESRRFICEASLEKLDIKDEIRRLHGLIGLGHIGYTRYPLYDDAARQFFASVRVCFLDCEPNQGPSPQTAVLSYFF
ncbi:unnamed protein product [Cochlearia groenlandica]